MSDVMSVADNDNDDDDDVDKFSRQAVKTIVHSRLKCRFTAQRCNATANSLRQRTAHALQCIGHRPGLATTPSLFTFFPLGLRPAGVNAIKDRFVLLFWEFSTREMEPLKAAARGREADRYGCACLVSHTHTHAHSSAALSLLGRQDQVTPLFSCSGEADLSPPILRPLILGSPRHPGSGPTTALHPPLRLPDLLTTVSTAKSTVSSVRMANQRKAVSESSEGAASEFYPLSACPMVQKACSSEPVRADGNPGVLADW